VVGIGGFAVASGIPPEEAARRIDASVRDRRTIEIVGGRQPSRRLVGSIDNGRVHLNIVDDDIWTRPKGFTIEFDGEIVATASGSELRGRIDLPDRRQLDILMWLFRVVGLLAGFVIVALATRGVSIVGPLLGGVAAAGLTWLATVYIKRGYLSRAAEDANLVEEHLRAILEAP
jgi:hypothetical protein